MYCVTALVHPLRGLGYGTKVASQRFSSHTAEPHPPWHPCLLLGSSLAAAEPPTIGSRGSYPVKRSGGAAPHTSSSDRRKRRISLELGAGDLDRAIRGSGAVVREDGVWPNVI